MVGSGETGVPIGNRHLSGDHRGGLSIAIVQDLEQVLRLGTGQGIAEPVIEDQELGASKGIEELGVGAVGVGKRNEVEETRSAMVTDREVVPASGVGQGTASMYLPPLVKTFSA